MSLVLQSVSPHIGAEVIGADLSQPVGDNLFRELHQAWVDADGLLIVRDQRLTPEQQITFSRQFGELSSAGDNPVIQKYTLPGYPEIFRVSNRSRTASRSVARMPAPTGIPTAPGRPFRRRPRSFTASRFQESAETPCSPTSIRLGRR